MRKLRNWLAVAAILLAAAPTFAQQVTLSARVKLVSAEKQAESPHAGGVVVWLTPLDSHTPLKPFHTGPLKLVQHNKSFEPHLLVVPIYSTLALDALAYERFLLSSGVLDAALRVLGHRALSDPFSAETTRKKIQSLVMAAEVQHIVDGMSA